MIDNPRVQAVGSLDSNYSNYGTICEMARRSKYLSSLPPLPVHCVPLGEFIYLQMHLDFIFSENYIGTLEHASAIKRYPNKKFLIPPRWRCDLITDYI